MRNKGTSLSAVKYTKEPPKVKSTKKWVNVKVIIIKHKYNKVWESMISECSKWTKWSLAVCFPFEGLHNVPALDCAVSEIFTEEALSTIPHPVSSVTNDWDSLKLTIRSGSRHWPLHALSEVVVSVSLLLCSIIVWFSWKDSTTCRRRESRL